MEQTKVSVGHGRVPMLHVNIIALILFSMTVLLFGSGCVSFERATPSGYSAYARESKSSTADGERKLFEREAAESELGPTSSDKAVASRLRLKRQEKMLEGKSEREQYYKAKPYLKNDAERLYFLGLDSTVERDRYLNAKGANGDQVTHPPEMQSLVEQNDLAAGMTRQAVKESWGPPDDVEVAGNPMYGNEKWKYSEQVTSREGYMTERRTVYFEAGRVVGWETR